MKQAVIGSNDYHGVMRQVASNALQNLAGYIPKKIEGVDSLPSYPLPLTPDLIEKAPTILSFATSVNTYNKIFNPRLAYLMIAEFLLSCSVIKNVYPDMVTFSKTLRDWSIDFCLLAMGVVTEKDCPFAHLSHFTIDRVLEIIKYYPKDDAELSVHDLFSNAPMARQNKVFMRWMWIDDSSVCRVVRDLVIDILSCKDASE